MPAVRAFVGALIVLAIATWSPVGFAQSDTVRDAQSRLFELGYDPGPVDGFMGPRTRAALSAFQADRDLRPTGDLDARTLDALTAAQSTAPAIRAGAGSVESQAGPAVARDRPAPEPETAAPDRAPHQATMPSAPMPATATDAARRAPGPPSIESMTWWWVGAGAFVLFLFLRRRNRSARTPARAPAPAMRAEPRVVERPTHGRAESLPPPAPSRPNADSSDVPPTAKIQPSSRPIPSRWVANARNRDFHWVPPDKSATVANIEIGGMVYVGPGLRSRRYGAPENCLIDPSLPVARQKADVRGEHLPYWPSYSSIAPASRLAYLQWLASGRSDPAYDVGYVFLYFYGLERRLFLDRPDPAERKALVAEAERLRTIYGSNRSFDRYSRALLEAAPLLAPEDSEPEPIFESSDWELPLSVKLGLGKRIAAGRPIDSAWLLSWWMIHPETSIRTPARRAFPEFKRLFELRFARRYPDGLRVATPKRRLAHTYRAASGTFERTFKEELAWCPDVSSLTKPLSIASDIADACMDELDAFSRYLGRNPEGRGTIEAHALLPDDLAELIPNDALHELRAWAERRIVENGGLVPAETVVERLEGKRPDRIGRRALVSAADALARVSIGLAPDPRFAFLAPKAGEPVVLFRLPEGVKNLEAVGARYPAALLSATLGIFVAHADGTVSETERLRLGAHIDKLTDLSESEKARLRANVDWMIASPPTLGPLRKRFEDLPEQQKHAIGQVAIAVAGADGQIEPAEIRAIQKLYKTMGLPEDGIFSDLHAVAGGPAIDPVTIRRPSPGPSGYVIPQPPEEEKTVAAHGLSLDRARVSAIMADTTRVSNVLSGIFADEEPEEETEEAAAAVDEVARSRFEGLDSSHRALVEELLTRAAWSEEEFGRLAEHFGLMAAGAQETINEWAFERFGDALIEEDRLLEVNREIANMLTGDKRETTNAAA